MQQNFNFYVIFDVTETRCMNSSDPQKYAKSNMFDNNFQVFSINILVSNEKRSSQK